jgi:hypothetical protein
MGAVVPISRAMENSAEAELGYAGEVVVTDFRENRFPDRIKELFE